MGEVKVASMAGIRQFKSKAVALRNAQTSAEARRWRALRGRRLTHWKFRRQHPIDRFVVDFVTIGGKLIVEVDSATHDGAAAIAHDMDRTHVRESLGFLLVRVTNTDVYENLDAVLEMIDSTLRRS
jgi:very-short-patch-repair endonuclease